MLDLVRGAKERGWLLAHCLSSSWYTFLQALQALGRQVLYWYLPCAVLSVTDAPQVSTHKDLG